MQDKAKQGLDCDVKPGSASQAGCRCCSSESCRRHGMWGSTGALNHSRCLMANQSVAVSSLSERGCHPLLSNLWPERHTAFSRLDCQSVRRSVTLLQEPLQARLSATNFQAKPCQRLATLCVRESNCSAVAKPQCGPEPQSGSGASCRTALLGWARFPNFGPGRS